MKKIKKKIGDRYDGRRVRKCDPLNVVIPYVMSARHDSQVLFDTEIDIDKVNAYIADKRQTYKDIGLLDFLITAMVRTISQYPRINRFIAGQKLFARDEICFSMVVKKELNINTPETTIKVKFEPDATIFDVSKQLRDLIASNKGVDKKNNTDNFVKILIGTPGFILKFIVDSIKCLDYFGIMPRFIHRLSPFHSSVFITNMGSIGAMPIYHHLYDFGTTSIFIAFGTRTKKIQLDRENNVSEKKILSIRFVADERIGDGFYLSSAMKYLNNLFNNPSNLELPPEKIVEDEQI